MLREERVYSRLVKLIDGKPHYFISFRDASGKIVEIDLNEETDVETAKKIFHEVQEQLREDLRQYRSDYRHLELLPLSTERIDEQAISHEESIEEVLLQNELMEKLSEAISALPVIQKRRFIMYYEDELNIYEIAEIEGCTPQAVQVGIKRASRNLRILIKKYRDGV